MALSKGIPQAQKWIDKCPGAVNPIAIRRISKAFFSRIATLRNGTTNTEGDINLANDDINETQITALIGASVPYVKSIYPQVSSGGTVLNQSSSSAQPQLEALSTKRTMKFDGIDDTFNYNTSLPEVSLNFTILMVLNIPVTSTGVILQISTNTGTDKRFTLAIYSGVINVRFYDAANGGYYGALQTNSAYSGKISISILNNNKTVSIKINNASASLVAGVSPPTAFPSAMFMAADRGFTSYWAGNVCDFIAYNRALSSDEITAYHSDAMGYYQIT